MEGMQRGKVIQEVSVLRLKLVGMLCQKEEAQGSDFGSCAHYRLEMTKDWVGLYLPSTLPQPLHFACYIHHSQGVLCILASAGHDLLTSE